MKICVDCGKELEQSVERCDCIENKALPNLFLDVIRQCVGKKLLLSAMIVFTVAVALNIFNDWISWFESSVDLGALDYCLYNIGGFFSRIGINDGQAMLLFFAIFTGEFSGVASAIPSIALTISMWLAYSYVNDENNHSVKPRGFWLAERMLILFAGVTFLGSLFTVMFGVLSFSVLLNSLNSGVFSWENVLALVYVIISPFCRIVVGVFYINMCKIVNNMRHSIENRVISPIRPFWIKIAVVFGGVSIIFTVISSFAVSGYPSAMVASNLISAVATILFGFFLLHLVDKIDDFVEKRRT